MGFCARGYRRQYQITRSRDGRYHLPGRFGGLAMMAGRAKRVRLSQFWLDLLRYMMGLGPGDHIIVLRVDGQGKRQILTRRQPQTLQ